MASKAGITVAIKGEIDDLEAKISQSKEIINDATKSIISENNKLIASQEALNRIQKTYSNEIDNANNEIKKYLELKSKNGKLTKEEQQNLAAARAELALYRTKTKELTDVERERQREIKRNIAVTRDMQNLQRASINDARLEIETKRKVIELEKQSLASKNNLEKSTSNLANTTIRYLRWAGTLVGTAYAIKRAWDATAGAGISINKVIENNTYGVAALVSANTQMVDSLGNTLSPIQKFTKGQEHAKKILEELRIESVKTAATFPQLLEIFQQGIGKTLSMGDSFGATTEEIEKNTIKLSARMSNFANAIGMPMDRVREEMRSLVSGNASTDSLISTIIFGSPGEANSAIRAAEKKVNGVADLLDEKFKAFDILADTKTFDKSILSIQDAWSRAMGDMVEKSGMFKDITNLFYEMSESIKNGSDGIVASFDSVYNSVKNIASILDDIAIAGAIFFVGSKLDKGLFGAAKMMSGFAVAAGGTAGIMLRLSTIVPLLTIKLKALALANPFTALAAAGMTAFEVFSKINDEIEKMRLGGKTVEEYEKQQKERLDKYNSPEEKFKRLEKEVQDLEKRKKATEEAKKIYGGLGLSTVEIENRLEKVNQELANSTFQYKKIKEELSDKGIAENLKEQTKEYGELITNIKIDIDRIEKDEKEILKTKGNIAEWESQIANYYKVKQESAEKLLKAEEAQAQAIRKNGKENLLIQKDIDNLKKDIANQDLLIALKQAKIDEEREKQREAELKKRLRANKKLAEEARILEEIRIYESGKIDLHELANAQQVLKLQGLGEELSLLEKGARYNEVYLKFLKETAQYQTMQDSFKIEDSLLETQKNIKKEIDAQVVSTERMIPLEQAKLELKNLELLMDGKISEEQYAKNLELIRTISLMKGQLDELKNFTIKINIEGWDDFSRGVAGLANSFQDMKIASEQYQKAQRELPQGSKELTRAQNQYATATISGYADMVGAVANFYDHDDSRRKKQLELQKVFYAAKMAMQLADLLQTTTTETAKQTLYGTTALANSLTAPFPANIAAYAMVAAMLASIGIMVGGKTKTSETWDDFSKLEANEGKGSVLGDATKASESLANSIEILEDFAEPQYRTLQSMDKHLARISGTIGGLTNILIREGGFAFGEGAVEFDTGWQKNSTAKFFDKAGDAWSKGINSNPITKALNFGNILTNDKIGIGAITKTLGKIAGSVFGKKSVTQTLHDSGIVFASAYMEDAIKSLNASTYQTILTVTKKKSMFKSSTSYSYNTYFSGIDREITNQFSLVLGGIYDTVLTTFDALDLDSDEMQKKMNKFKVELGKISLKGKTGEQIQQMFQNIFGKLADDLVKFTFSGVNTLEPFQKAGEAIFETLTRVATGMEESKYYIERLGAGFAKVDFRSIENTQGDVGFEALLQSIVAFEETLYPVNNGLLDIVSGLNVAAEELYGIYVSLDNLRETFKYLKVDIEAVSHATIRGAGSFEALTDGVKNYIENFLTEEEQLEHSIVMLKKEFAKLDMEMPTSKQAFKDLLASLDLTTEAGQELYGRLIVLSKGFADVADESEKVHDKTISKITSIQKAFLDMVSLIDNTINTLLGRQTGNQTTDATITNYLAKREQVDMLLGKGSNISESELKTLNGLVSELASMASTIQSGFDDNTNITTNLVKDLALIKSKLNYTNQFVETDIKKQEGTILRGFSTGGYTGNGAIDEIKGYVHGNEWVVNSAQVNAIGGPDAVRNMVQKEIIQKNTKIQTTKLEYSNNKSDIIDKVMTGQDIIVNGFNAILSKIDEIIDYNEERREQKHSVLVSGTVNIGG